MRSAGSGGGGGNGGGGGGIIPSSFRALSGYFRIVSSGASTVASSMKSAASAASAIVDRDSDSTRDQVHWAAFDKLECDDCVSRQVLLLGYPHGFQVWDVDDVNNVSNVVSRRDGPVSFMQILPKLLPSKKSKDKFVDSRPVMIICTDGGSSIPESARYNGTIQGGHELPNGTVMPTVVQFYSLRSHSYVDMLKFRSIVHLVRCSSRVIAVLQASQIHIFDAATLEMVHNTLTNPVPAGCGLGAGFGPLAVGPRWVAYSGSPIDISNTGRLSPQELTAAARFPGSVSNGSLVAHYARESSKHLATGIMALGDMGYKKLSRYYSELLPDGTNSQSGNARATVPGNVNGQSDDVENVGMVIVKDTVQKTVISQFRAHTSPISSLCFDPSGTLLVTASVHGHNINVFRIIPQDGSGTSYMHLYRLQRGFTNALIQDICFSRDSEWIIISSSRGTSHLFAITPFGGSEGHPYPEPPSGPKASGYGTLTRTASYSSLNSGMKVLNQPSCFSSASPVTLSVVSRIRSGNNGWRNTVTGAAVAATGRANNLCGAVAAAFHYCKGNYLYPDTSFLKTNCHMLVFSSPGCLVHYEMRVPSGSDSVQGAGTAYDSSVDSDSGLVIEAMRKWNIHEKHNRKEREENIDIYGENGYSDNRKVYPEGMGMKKGISSEVRDTLSKDKIASEERYQMYISEAELVMHPPQVPLWTKAEVYFHAMARDGMHMGDEASLSGEFEIERIPTRAIEVSRKELVPVFDYLQAPKFQPGREVINKPNDGELLHQNPVVSKNSPGSLDTMTSGGTAVNSIEELGWHESAMPGGLSNGGTVNNPGHPIAEACHPETVNNREDSVTEKKSDFVNSISGLEEESPLSGFSSDFD